MEAKSTKVHKVINVLLTISCLCAVVSYVFLIVYICQLLDSAYEDDNENTDKKNSLESISLIVFTTTLIISEILGVVVCFILCAYKNNFANQSNYFVVLTLMTMSIFFSPYIGACIFVVVILIVQVDAKKVKNPDMATNVGETEMKKTTVIMIGVVKDTPPTEKDTAYTSAVPSDQYDQQNKEEDTYAAEHPYAQPNSYGYQF